ncbi:hypothetical protein DVA67_035260 [Solirubrobacter sp. CPCC 204708]|nr:hypothetical protein [Solirubrobacter deserti]
MPAPADYSSAATDYIWVHPYFHSYSQHIERHAGYIYLPFEESLEGMAVIRACRLDKIGAIELRSAEESAGSYIGLMDFLTELWINYSLTDQQMTEIIVKKFMQLDPQHVLRALVSENKDIYGLVRVAAEIEAML